MVKGSSLCSAAVAAALFASVSTAQADSNGNARAVIRGTGTDVTIVYRAPKAAPPDLEYSPSSDVVDEMLRMTTSDDDDATIIAFLRLHQAQLPDVIDADAVRDLRRAGAGEPVIAVLSTFAALDIGETGEGSPQAPQTFQDTAPYAGAYPDLVGMEYPFYPSYGGGYFGGGSLGRHSFGKGFGRHGRHGSHFGKGSFPKGQVPKGHFPKGGSRPAHPGRGASTAHRIR